MPDPITSGCAAIEARVTPYVDGELAAGDRAVVDAHVTACGRCRSRVAAERAVRELIDARKASLRAAAAPHALHARCARLAAGTDGAITAGRGTGSGRHDWRARLAPLAVAAALVLIVAGAFVYQVTERSNDVMAAELAVDHMKCFLLDAALRGGAGEFGTNEAVERALATKFGWEGRLPADPGRAGLQLIGERTCLYGEGRVAHIMYRHRGRPVSLFMLPRDMRTEEITDALGHHASIWTVGSRAFVLVAKEPRSEIERMTSFVRAGLQ
jgi:anti-sigma factor RsiW